ncbi:hypothetical protein Tco_0184600 [Tanacetum coccineum]
MESVKKSIGERAQHKMHSVIIGSNGTESKEQDTSSRSGNDAHVDDADIRPINDEEPMAEIAHALLDGFYRKRHSPLAQQRYSLKYRYIALSYRGRTQSLVTKKKDIAANRASRNFDLMITLMTFEQNSSSLGLHVNDFRASFFHSNDFCIITFRNSEFEYHSNEPSSSKLVPKVVPLAVKTATSRPELELLFHHHIAMPRTTGLESQSMINQKNRRSTKDNPKLEIAVLRWQSAPAKSTKQNALIESRAKRSIKISLGHIPFQTLVEHHQVHKLLSRVLRNIIVIFARTFRVILFSIHNDEWKSFQCHHQTALRTRFRKDGKTIKTMTKLKVNDRKAEGKQVYNKLNEDKTKALVLNVKSNLTDLIVGSVINELTSGEIVSLNFIESIKEARSRVQDLTSGEIVSLNSLSRTRKLGHSTMELRSLIS